MDLVENLKLSEISNQLIQAFIFEPDELDRIELNNTERQKIEKYVRMPTQFICCLFLLCIIKF